MKNIKEIKLAITVICTIVIIYFGLSYLKGINIFKSYSTYNILFNDVTGLEESNPVYVNGFPIGIVRSIDYDYTKSGQITVKIEVDKKMQIPEDSYAEIKQGLIGGTAMMIKLGQGRVLAPGGSFKGSEEIGIMSKAKELMPTVEKMLPKIDSILTSLNNILGDPAINSIISNANTITRNLTLTTDQLNNLMKKDIPVLMAQLNVITKNTGDITSQLKEVDFISTIQNVNNTILEAKQLTASLNEKINSPKGSLGLLLNDNQLYNNLNSTLMSTDALLQDLKAHPKRYVHFSLFGKKSE